jgi:catechol 2,3-dioxygenase-like lactoylglutathione lyase family enzyme
MGRFAQIREYRGFRIQIRAVTLAGKKQRWGGISMFSHVMIGTNDLDKAKSFYDALLGTLGIPPGRVDRHRIFWRSKTGTFSVTKPINGEDATCANGGTIGFAAASQAEADAFHAAGLAHGGKTCEEPPGIREGGGVKLYIAYLRDPDGNKLCALHRVA